MTTFKKIIHKWGNYTSDLNGFFVRHMDGNTLNNCRSNLELIHPHDAFSNPHYSVDWVCPLTKKEINFVHEHIGAFLTYYEKQK